MIKAVIFDLDWTLTKFTWDFKFILKSAFEKYEIILSDENMTIILACFGQRINNPWRYNTIDIFTDIFQKIWLNLQKLHNIMNDFIVNYISYIDILDKEIYKLLENLQRSYKLWIVSNWPSDLQRLSIQKAWLEKYFDEIVISWDINIWINKPNKEIFEKMNSRLKEKNWDIIMVWDSFEKDIKPAQELWLQTLLVGEKTLLDYKKDLVI